MLKRCSLSVIQTDDIEFDNISYEFYIDEIIKKIEFKYKKDCIREMTSIEEFVRKIEDQTK